jgi:hypothetical protein
MEVAIVGKITSHFLHIVPLSLLGVSRVVDVGAPGGASENFQKA